MFDCLKAVASGLYIWLFNYHTLVPHPGMEQEHYHILCDRGPRTPMGMGIQGSKNPDGDPGVQEPVDRGSIGDLHDLMVNTWQSS